MMSEFDMVEVTLNGKYDLILPRYRADRLEWTTPPFWEYERIESMLANIRPTDVVFDIGAEQADISALLAKKAKKMVLFEPNPLVWPNIMAVWKANKLPHPDWFTGFAANDTSEHPNEIEPAFELPEKDGWPGCAYGDMILDHGFRNVSERTHDTPQIKLDRFCQTRKVYPDVITMDVEGAELEVLKGAYETLRQRKPLVYVSVHPDFMEQMYGQTIEDLYEYMAAAGYTREHLATDHEIHMCFYNVEARRLR